MENQFPHKFQQEKKQEIEIEFSGTVKKKKIKKIAKKSVGQVSRGYDYAFLAILCVSLWQKKIKNKFIVS